MIDQATETPAGGATETPGGLSYEVDITAPTAAQLAEPTQKVKDFMSSVPTEWADKPWVKELTKAEDPRVELYKKVDNLQELAGRKGEGLKVPAADAPEAEWADLRKALGVPEKPEGYEYTAPKPPEGQEAHFQTDEKLLATMRAAAHKAGMTPQGWKQMTAEFDAYGAAAVKDMLAAQAAQQTELQAKFNETYGEKSPQVLANWSKATDAAPDWAKATLNALPPAYKAAVAASYKNFTDKYVSEDRMDLKEGVTSQGAMTETEYGNEYEKLFAAVRDTQRNPGSAEHLRAKTALAALRARGMSEVFKK